MKRGYDSNLTFFFSNWENREKTIHLYIFCTLSFLWPQGELESILVDLGANHLHSDLWLLYSFVISLTIPFIVLYDTPMSDPLKRFSILTF